MDAGTIIPGIITGSSSADAGGGSSTAFSLYSGSDASRRAKGPGSVSSNVSRSTFGSRLTHGTQYSRLTYATSKSRRTTSGRHHHAHAHSAHGRGPSRRFGLERRQHGVRGDIRHSFQHTRQWLVLSLVFENVGIAILRDQRPPPPPPPVMVDDHDDDLSLIHI